MTANAKTQLHSSIVVKNSTGHLLNGLTFGVWVNIWWNSETMTQVFAPLTGLFSTAKVTSNKSNKHGFK